MNQRKKIKNHDDGINRTCFWMDGDIGVMFKKKIMREEVDASLMLVLFVPFARNLVTPSSSDIVMRNTLGACME